MTGHIFVLLFVPIRKRLKVALNELRMISNEELMQQIQGGSEEAFEELYGRFRGQVYGFISKKVKGDDRDEVFQIVFLKLHQKSHLYKTEYPFSPWFFTLIRNTVIDFYRSNKVEYVSLEEESLVSSGDDSDSLGLASADLGRLDGISSEEQILLYKKFVEGQGYVDLEAHFGIKAASLRKRVSRLIKKLRNREGIS